MKFVLFCSFMSKLLNPGQAFLVGLHHTQDPGGDGCEHSPSAPQPWAIHTPTFTLIVLGVEIDGKVMGYLGRRDWSAGPPPRTPHPQLTEITSLKPS